LGREATMKPDYEILAYITMNSKRVLGGKAQALLAKNEEEQRIIAQDIAKALKADTVKLKCGDYMVIRV